VERALDAVDMLPEGHEVRHNPRPMMSLLFQEPVLPSVADSRDRADDDRDDSRNDRGERNDRNAQDHDDEQDEDRPSRRRRRRNRDVADEERSEDNRNERDNRDNRNDDADNDEEGGSRKSRRSRRLNAQERRAAAEVEQIEEDLILDDITYAPIDDETRNRNDDDDDEQPTRTRRRRRSRGNREEADEQQRDSDEGESRRRREDDDEDEGTVTRRRRRRRGGAKADEAEEPLVRRSRKQQYIDEITDVEGSTRLEAKKQRRRDNRRERSRQSQLMEQDFLARREHVDRLMVVRERERHTQISVIEDNVLVEHYVSDIQEVATVGNIYLGRVQNVLPSMEAAFVDIGQARNGVLYAGEVNWDSARLEGQPRRIELAFKSGDPVLVQVTKDPIGHKGARLTSQVTLAGRFLVLVPSGGMTGVSRKLSERERSRLKNIVSKVAPKDMGVIIRTAAEGASEEAITKDLESLVRQWERITSKRDEFLHGKRPKLLQGEPDVAIRVVRDIFNDDFSKMIVEGDRVYGIQGTLHRRLLIMGIIDGSATTRHLIVLIRIIGETAATTRRTILVLLILNLHRTTATRTRRPFVGNLTNIIIGLDRTTTATGRTGHTLGIGGITGIMRRLRNRQLRLLEQRSRSMLLDLQLQGRTGSSHATHHATTATTATRGRIGLDRLEFHNIHGMLRRCRSFDLIEALTGIRHNGSSTTRCNRAAHA
jgi:ribonuclease E